MEDWVEPGCRSAGCRTLFDCICTCKLCRAVCPDRAVRKLRALFPLPIAKATGGTCNPPAPQESEEP